LEAEYQVRFIIDYQTRGQIVQVQKLELVKYFATVRSMENYFLSFTVRGFPRAMNKEVDKLGNTVA
jgi:hypothetical protein